MAQEVGAHAVVSLKDELLGDISDAVKKLQLEQFSTDSDEIEPLNNEHPDLQRLCEKLDHVLLHGIKGFERGYWPYVAEYTRKEEVHLIRHLSSVSTDLGRGRAWLLQALNENALENYLRLFSSNDALMARKYDPNAIMRDEERLPVLLTLASGLDHLTFELTIDCEYFDYGAFSPSKAGLLNMGPLSLNKLMSIHLPTTKKVSSSQPTTPTESNTITSSINFVTSKVKNFLARTRDESESELSKSAPDKVSALQSFSEESSKSATTPSETTRTWSWSNVASKVAQKARSAKEIAVSKATAAKSLVMDKLKRDKGIGGDEKWAAVNIDSGAPIRVKSSSQGEAEEKAKEDVSLPVGRFERIESIPEEIDGKMRDGGPMGGQGEDEAKGSSLEVRHLKKGKRKKKKKQSPEERRKKSIRKVSTEAKEADAASLLEDDLRQSDSSSRTISIEEKSIENASALGGPEISSDSVAAPREKDELVEEKEEGDFVDGKESKAEEKEEEEIATSPALPNEIAPPVEEEEEQEIEPVPIETTSKEDLEESNEKENALEEPGESADNKSAASEEKPEETGSQGDKSEDVEPEVSTSKEEEEKERESVDERAVFDSSGFPVVPFLTDDDFKSADITLEENTKLFLVLNILGNDDEEIIKFVNVLRVRAKSKYLSAYFLISDAVLYVLGKDGSGDRFEKLEQWPLTKVNNLAVSLNWQTLTLTDRKRESLTIVTANEAVTRSLCTTIQLIASERCALSLPIFKSDDTRDMLIRKACLASDDSKVAPIQHYALVFWQPQDNSPGIDSAYKSHRVIKQGKLNVQTSLLGVTYWREDYFVLDVKNGVIMQFGNQNDRDCKASFTLRGGKCGGCRRRQDCDKPNAFEIISFDKNVDSMVLATDSSDETQEWMMRILEGVAGTGAASDDRSRDPISCSLAILANKIHLFYEHHKNEPIELITSCQVDTITSASYDSDCLAYSSLNFELFDNTEGGSWLLFFASSHELAKFQLALATQWKDMFQINLPFSEMADGRKRNRARDTVSLLRSTIHRNDSLTRGRDNT